MKKNRNEEAVSGRFLIQVWAREVNIMKNIFSSIDWKKTGLFAAGVAFGTAGIKVLSSDDAKKYIPTVPQLFFAQRIV